MHSYILESCLAARQVHALKTMKDKQIFVTGGTGFVGSYLLRYLVQQGYTKIRACHRATSRMDMVAEVADAIEWVEGDILDVLFLEEVMADVDLVYHSAAVVSFDPRFRKQLYAINQEGTANMVNVALHCGVEKFLHVSSIAVFGKREAEGMVTEKSKWERNPANSDYTISKYMAEQEVWRGIAEGLPAVMVNPSVIMGSGFWDAGPARFFTQVWNGLKFWPSGMTGFVDVRDVARYMILLMESDVVSERYILNGENWAFKTIFDTIADLLKVKKPSIRVTPFLATMAWRIEWLRSRLTGKQPMVTKATADSAMRTYRFDNQKSLGLFDFQYTPIADTLRDSAAQFLEGEKEGFKPKYLDLN